jgi:hypothetical protein
MISTDHIEHLILFDVSEKTERILKASRTIMRDSMAWDVRARARSSIRLEVWYNIDENVYLPIRQKHKQGNSDII